MGPKLDENWDQNLVYMVFSPLPRHNHHEIYRVNVNWNEYNYG